MQIDANRHMEIFWGKILGGSIIGGACLIGGRAVLPALPEAAGWMGLAAGAAAH